MNQTRPLSERQLNAIGARIRALGDMEIPISHLALARLIITTQTPFAFGVRVLEYGNDGKRHVDAIALNALLLIAESKLPKPAPQPVLHAFRPASRSPWICADCGYSPSEGLKHFMASA